MTDEAVLHDYWRSSASYRLRIALNLKKIAYRAVSVDLRAGEQRAAAHLARNPQGLVPVLEIDGRTMTQSLAVIDYLEETRPRPALLPQDSLGRQRVRSLAQLVALDIHPICNLHVVQELQRLTDGGEASKAAWMRHFIGRGFSALEARLQEPESGGFCHGDRVTLADLCLVPQVYNAERWQLDMTAYPTIARINAACLALSAFEAAPAGETAGPDIGLWYWLVCDEWL